MHGGVTSAGEVEQYGYCAHNWWLAQRGAGGKGDGSVHGIKAHKDRGVAQKQVEGEKKEFRRALDWSFIILAMSGSATFLTLELRFLRAHEHHLILLATALVLVGASAGLLVLSLIYQKRYKTHQKEGSMIPGRLVASDLSGTGPLLEDPEWGLRGRPDSVVAGRDGWIPVEFKAGKTPERPHRNHVLQLGCYLRLLEAKTGLKPEYGLLNYPEGVFRVAWDKALEHDVKETVGKIRQAAESGVADRDHGQPRRCRGCARRDACDQRLA